MPIAYRMTRRGAAVACAMMALGVSAAQPPIRAVATTSDLASLLAPVCGDLAAIATIVPAGGDPEEFEPRASDAALLADASLIVRAGLGYDAWLDRLLANVPARRDRNVLDASAGIPLLEVNGRDPFAHGGHAHALANPHYWLDPVNAETMTVAIAAALVRQRPLAKEAVLSNRHRFVDRLHDAERAWESQLGPHRGTAVLTYHNSWPYFARRFRLNVVGFIEPKEGVAPSAAHLASLIGLARRQNVRAILQTSNEPTGLARMLSERTGATLVRLAPAVGSVPSTGDYLAFMSHNVGTLARALDASR